MTQISLEDGVAILDNFRAQRAFDAGYKARLEGKPKEAIPTDMHIFTGNWVDGWWAADLELMPEPDRVRLGTVQRVRDVPRLHAPSVVPEIEFVSTC